MFRLAFFTPQRTMYKGRDPTHNPSLAESKIKNCMTDARLNFWFNICELVAINLANLISYVRNRRVQSIFHIKILVLVILRQFS